MKNVLKYSMLILTAVFLTCCSNDDGNDNEYPYYQFDQADAALIIKYDYGIGEIITYENQNVEELNFIVIENETSRQGYYVGGSFSGGGGVYSYYESKIIRFEIVENQSYGFEGLVNYIFSKSENSFKNGVNFPLWNESNSFFMDELDNHSNIPFMDFESTPNTKININGHLFERTIVIESNSDDINQIASYGTLPSNVNKVYYDYDFGIVQFDDLEGNEWKVIYPE